MICREITYPSANGINNIYATLWLPEDRTNIKGVIQMSHGMCEHIGRYKEFAEFLVSNGYAACGNDHAGHGRSQNGIFGYFGEKGYGDVIEDMHTLHLIMKKEFKSEKYFLLGHSMGSFLSRVYCAQYGGEFDGLLLSGTGSYQPNLNLGIVVAWLCSVILGKKSEGRFIARVQSRAAHSKIKKGSWLTSDEDKLREFKEDKFCGFAFTNGAYFDLFTLIKYVVNDSVVKSFPKNFPIYIFSGDLDPIGGYGAGVRKFYESIIKEGNQKAVCKIYKGGRHEMLNEINRREVFEDILDFLKSV